MLCITAPPPPPPPPAVAAASPNGCWPIRHSAASTPSDQMSFWGRRAADMGRLLNAASTTSGAQYAGVPPACKLLHRSVGVVAAADRLLVRLKLLLPTAPSPALQLLMVSEAAEPSSSDVSLSAPPPDGWSKSLRLRLLLLGVWQPPLLLSQLQPSPQPPLKGPWWWWWCAAGGEQGALMGCAEVVQPAASSGPTARLKSPRRALPPARKVFSGFKSRCTYPCVRGEGTAEVDRSIGSARGTGWC